MRCACQTVADGGTINRGLIGGFSSPKIKVEIKLCFTRAPSVGINSTSILSVSRHLSRQIIYSSVSIPHVTSSLFLIGQLRPRFQTVIKPRSTLTIPAQHIHSPHNPSPPLLFILPPISSPSPNLAPSPPPHDHPYRFLTPAWTKRNT